MAMRDSGSRDEVRKTGREMAEKVIKNLEPEWRKVERAFKKIHATGGARMLGEQMKLSEAVNRACQEPTLLEALSWICVWESERIVRQAKASAHWQTCFGACIELVLKEYLSKNDQGLPDCPIIPDPRLIDFEFQLAEKAGYLKAQQDMLQAGFVNCSPKQLKHYKPPSLRRGIVYKV